MNLWTDLNQVPPGFGPSVVTIGNFDGVHRGHVEVLGRVVDLARRGDASSVAVTFYPHPAAVHRPQSAPALILGIADRLEAIGETGVDACLLIEYTLDFASQSADEFVRRYLVEALGAKTVVVGHDVRFGSGNAGTLTTMVDLGERYGFDVLAVADAGDCPVHGDAHPRWSSTDAREHLLAGDVSTAAHILGRRHRVRGVVVHGEARGRELGFPTANLAETSGMVPADGVYAGWLIRPQLAVADPGNPDIRMPAAISIGTNPTFDDKGRRVEAHVLGRDDLDLYDEEVVVEFVEHLRPTLRFDGVGALVAQMRADVAQARKILGVRTPAQASGELR